MAFEPEIDHILHSKLSYVEPGQRALSIAAISEKIHQAFPKDTINGFDLSTVPNISFGVYTNTRTIYIDQYSGNILGTMQGPDFWQRTQNNIHQLHLRLALRDSHDVGKSVMSWAGVILLIILPSGVVLWWKQKRLSVRRNGSSRQVWFDLHSLVGITLFIFLLILAFTGSIIGFENKTVPLLYKLTASQPSARPDIKITRPGNAKQISPDNAVQIARLALPGALPFNINIPGATDAYAVGCRYPEDRTPGGRSSVTIDPYSGKVLYSEASRTAPAGTRLKNMVRAIHTGDILGLFSKTIMSLASLALGFQVISGLKMWWLRKWKKKKVQVSRA